MKNRAMTRLLILAVILLTAGIVTAGVVFYRYQERNLRRAAETQLASIAELKVSDLVRWREERIQDTRELTEGRPFRIAVHRILQGSPIESEPIVSERLRNFKAILGYDDISLVDSEGRIRFRQSGTQKTFPRNMVPVLEEVFRTGQSSVTDLHLGLQDGKPHLDLVVPLLEPDSSKPFGLVVVRVDAERNLFPLLRSWPVQSRSAETLLVRREGDEVLFLNNLRHWKNTALKLRYSLSHRDIPAVAAALGQEGAFAGRDYRGVKVLSIIKSVPNCSWRLIAKVDQDEALEGWRRDSKLILGSTACLLATTIALAGLLWQRLRRIQLEQQLRTESALAQEREQLAVTLRSIGDGVITTDTKGRIVLMNKVAEQLTGWKNEEAEGRPLPEVFRIVHEYTGEACENPVDKVLLTGAVVELANHTTLISRDNLTYIIADSGAPIRDSRSEIIGVVLVFRNVTEKQRLEDSMRRAQKLDALGVLAGGIAHDFNNLLSGIFGYMDLGRDQIRLGQNDKAMNSLNRALDVFNRAKALTQQLLTFSKGGAPQRKSQLIQPLIRESASFSLSGSSIACEFDLAEDLSPCDIDEHQIAQVISNLVLNAQQAMPGGGLLRITARNLGLRAGECPPLPPGLFVEIAVKDNGVGMPPEILPHIFDPFFSTKQQGSGLGLATAHSILERHDGTILVESTPGKGSLFKVLLPVSGRVPAHVAESSRILSPGNGKVLLMDDEDFVRQIAAETLRSLGYTVEVAADGQETLKKYSDAHLESNPFSLVILDLTVPGGMGGLETAKRLRMLDKNAVLIVSSGYSNDPVMCDPEAYGFSARINKPYLRADLAEIVAKCLKKS